MMWMFYITVWQKYMVDFDNEETLQNLMDLSDSPVMLAELIDLLQYHFDQIDLVDEPLDIGFDCLLDVHCTYTTRQQAQEKNNGVPAMKEQVAREEEPKESEKQTGRKVQKRKVGTRDFVIRTSVRSCMYTLTSYTF